MQHVRGVVVYDGHEAGHQPLGVTVAPPGVVPQVEAGEGVQCSIVQYSTVQCSTVQYSTVQYSTSPTLGMMTFRWNNLLIFGTVLTWHS